MYGTVARMRIKPDMLNRMQEFDRQMSEASNQIPGLVFEYTYQMDDDPNVVYLCVGFESKEAYVTNADSPEMHQRYLQYREYLAEEPQWHDGEIIGSTMR